MFASDFGRWLLQFPSLLRSMTMTVYLLEWFGPALAFFPFFNTPLRTGVVIVFLALHAGLAVAMDLYAFQLIVFVAWLPFLPTPACDALARWGRAVMGRLPGWTKFPSANAAGPSADRGGWLPHALAGALAVYIILWNAREIWPESRVLPKQLDSLGWVTGLNQRWDLFAPYPLIDDGWYVMEGQLNDGEPVNLWSPGQPLPLDKPAHVSHLYRNRRWQKYLINLLDANNAAHRAELAAWLARRWNEQQTGNDSRRIAAVHLGFMVEPTPPPGEPLPPPTWVRLGTWRPAE
jgi:hypothetical protein